jgi:multicomponent K+:H+ antiporter subunit D
MRGAGSSMPCFHFQLMGLHGAFLTGDLFNLFVFFEVMLIASYGLMLQGLGAERLRATFHYVTINLTGSGVFLIAVSLLYGVTGTLNMAHLAERVASAPPEDIALIRVAGLLLIGVFSVKGALFPLYFWLPAAYSSAAPPVAALFAIMTKVGVYSIIRVSTLIFGAEAGAAGDLTSPWLLPLALITFALAALGVVGASRLGGLVAYVTVASVGTMLTAVAIGGAAGLSAALYYVVHSTLVVAVLFLLVDLIERQRGERRDYLTPGPLLVRPALLGFAFLVVGVIAVGLPPSSGFLGKLMVLRSAEGAAGMAWVWLVLLAGTAVILIGCARAGSMLFWNVGEEPLAGARAPRAGEWFSVGLLTAASAAIVLWSAPLKMHLDATAAELTTPRVYIDGVLGERPEPLTRPLPVRGRP